MTVITAKSAGYCFGVARAMDICSSKAQSGNSTPIVTYGEIIHNKEAVKTLESLGVRVIDDIGELDNMTNEPPEVIIRAHGVPPDVYTELSRRGVTYTDCTCPHVKKIHSIVSRHAGDFVVIIGDRDHPEVIGIKGYAGENCAVVSTEDEAETVWNQFAEIPANVCVVAQTTFKQSLFYIIENKLKKILQNKTKNVIVYNTLCPETKARQEEAQTLSQTCDVMLVVGDKKSANTKKLYEICSNNCTRTYFLETICDLVLNNIKKRDIIGIISGASTMPGIIKEVARYMAELDNNLDGNYEEDNRTFEEMLNDSLVSLHTGDVVKGTVISIHNGEVSVNLGYKSDGIIERGEYSSDPSVLPANELKPGDTIEVFVVRVNDGEGDVLLSKKRLESQKNMEFIENAFETGVPIEVKVTEVVNAGLVAVHKGVRLFIPRSQVSNRFTEDLTQFKNKNLTVNIIELDKTKRRVIGSRRDIAKKEEEARRGEVFDTLKVGDKVEGTVSRIVTFGAFVDLGGIDGLIHVSELSWGGVKNPKDVLKEGQKVTTIVLDANREKGKIALSLKDMDDDPWHNVEVEYNIGDIIECKVARLAPFGAFVELKNGVDGLIHISQISSRHIEKCEDELKVGDMVTVKVLDVNREKRKISLSKRALDEPAEAAAESADNNATVEEKVEVAPVVEAAEEVATEEAATE